MQVVERSIAMIASGQDNVITRAQLLGAGLGRGAIAHRVQAGMMQRLFTNIYLMGAAPPTLMARGRAAALACGPDAAVSHRSAAELLGLLPAADGDIDVTVAGRNVWPRAGIRCHRVAAFLPGDVVTLRGVPITSVARTICDLAATESARLVEEAFQKALFRRRDIDRAVAAVLAQEPKRKGAPLLRALLCDPRLTRPERERILLALIDKAQLPRPLTNVRRHGYLLDAFWPAEGLVVEFDGWQAHGHRAACERDRKRDQVLVAACLRVIRVTDRQLIDEPVAVAARIAQALAHRR